MPAVIYYDQDADLGRLAGKTVAIIGYGSQGHAHALNLRDSGVKVVVGLPETSKSRAAAAAEGLTVHTPVEAAAAADVVMLLVPDHVQKSVFDEIKGNLTAGKTLMFAHGFNIHFDQIQPPPGVDVSMVAPKAPGHRVRELYEEGIGVPALIAVAQDASGEAKANGLAYARGIGSTSAGVLETTFKEETETDLFGEQVVLCGGVSALIQAGYETLVDAGYEPESAYFECLHELKLIVDLIYEGGLNYMRYSVSDTAEYGDYYAGPQIINDQVKATMKEILGKVQDGTFAKEWIAENQNGRGNFLSMRQAAQTHPIEKVGAELRSMMPWLKKGKVPAAASNVGN